MPESSKPFIDFKSRIQHTERIITEDFIIHRNIYNGLFVESKFDILTKFFYLDIYNNNVLVKLIISSCSDSVIQKWDLEERPLLKIRYEFIKNIDELSIEEREICNFIIRETLKILREKKYIKFDTDKDIRRQIALSFKRPWYKYPG